MKRHALALLLCLCLLLSGCSVLDSSSLLMLPEISPEQARLLQLVNAVTANSDWTTTAPSKGDDMATMNFVDFYGDGVEEAVCFFRNTAEMRLRISVYSNTGPAGYDELCTVETDGSAFDYVTYQDLDGDGSLEMAVFTRYGAEGIYGAEVYRFRDNQGQRVNLGACSSYSLCDLTLDGLSDIVLLRRGNDSAAAVGVEDVDIAELFSWVNGIATRMGQVSVMAGNPGTESVITGKLNPSMAGCIFDVQHTVPDGNVWVSNVLSWDGEFVNLSTQWLNSAMDTARSQKILCRDANFDGFLEIPMCGAMPALDEKYTVWFSFNTDLTLIQKNITYCRAGTDWYYIMPEIWHSKVYVKTGTYGAFSTVAFVADKNGRPNTLLTIYFTDDEVTDELPEGSFEIITSGNRSYFALLGIPDALAPLDADMYVYSPDEVFRRFVIVDSTGQGTIAIKER